MTTVRRVDNNTFDVFTGNQWDDWTRIRVGRSSTYRVAGHALPREIFNELKALLAPFMPINYEHSQEHTLYNCSFIR